MHMDIEITETDLTEKKLFFHTDLAEVEAWKVRHKLAEEAGFPCIPTI